MIPNIKIRYGKALGERVCVNKRRKYKVNSVCTIENTYLPSIGYRNKKD